MLKKTALPTGFPGQALLLLAVAVLLLLAGFGQPAGADDPVAETVPTVTSGDPEETSLPLASEQPVQEEKVGSDSRNQAMIASLTIFVLAIFIGFEIITKVPPTLHTPLMSGSNAISGITLVGAVIVAGHSQGTVAPLLGMVAVSLATVNVIGGFLVTHRMLSMFVKRK